MSPINFDILRDEYPEFSAVWPELQRWFETNRQKRYVELSVLVRALPQVKKIDLVLAIQAMLDEQMLRTSYRVKAPGGYLLEGDFAEPDEIPRELPDRDYSGHIPLAESDIVSGYRWEPAGAA